MTPPLLREHKGFVTTLTLNRADARNPISDADMVDALVSSLDELEHDNQCRVLIITGAGSAFSAGGNIKHMQQREGMFAGSGQQIAAHYRNGIQRIPKALYRFRKPVIAAVNGPAYGAGCDLAMMCDLRVAADSAVFAENFVRLGLIPGDGGAWFLPRIIGHARASEMALTGRAIDAHTALAWGMVSQVVSADRLIHCAQALAEEVAANPPQAVALTKRLLRQARSADLDGFLDTCASMQATCHHSDDHQEAVNAFLEKRPPIFTDR